MVKYGVNNYVALTLHIKSKAFPVSDTNTCAYIQIFHFLKLLSVSMCVCVSASLFNSSCINIKTLTSYHKPFILEWRPILVPYKNKT
jgi:hypothetical protein